MKRTAKWQKHLRIADLRHMREMGASSLISFRRLRDSQAKLKARLIEMNGGEECGTLTEPCWECRSIERKLFDAGVLKQQTP